LIHGENRQKHNVLKKNDRSDKNNNLLKILKRTDYVCMFEIHLLNNVIFRMKI